VEEAVDVPTLRGAIEAPRAQGLTEPVVVCMFIHRWILPLREQAHPLWLHQGITDLMMEFPYAISETLLWVLMLEAVGMDYSALPPFNADHPSSASQPFVGMMSEPRPHLLRWSGHGWWHPHQGC